MCLKRFLVDFLVDFFLFLNFDSGSGFFMVTLPKGNSNAARKFFL